MYNRLRKYLKPGTTAVVFAALCGCSLLGVGAAANTGPYAGGRGATLDKRMRSFVASFDSLSAQEFVEFFPRTGDVLYRHTRHTPNGAEVIIRRFSAAEIPVALEYSGPLWASFQFQFEGQLIGLLTHQVMVRTGEWRRVTESRFVPPDADPASPAFVEWRREGHHWVISEFGDESFEDVPLPAWVSDY